MIDLHTHTFFSDGELLPSELIRRAHMAGYKALAITDHMDVSNIDLVIPRILAAIEAVAQFTDMKIIPGAEITHVPPEIVGELVEKARTLGARIVIVHGETVVEPVVEGTNRAGIEAGADIISHPGLITREDALKAKEKGVALEITSRKGHSLSNGHVAKTALEVGADLVINTDAHSPGDLITREHARMLLRSAGISGDAIERVFKNSQKIVDRST
ncbi:histidinol phosphate phosphatase domain-containing protein [bacterium]|nr:MAG: histidinol phosphate phosphatase domain-containing protein [bacterium]